MTASANAGTDGRNVELQWPSSDEEIQSLKRLLQDQRRRATVLNADIQREIEAREAVQGRLIEAHAEIAASRDRRKEMARVITNREVKIARLNRELQARHEAREAVKVQLIEAHAEITASRDRRKEMARLITNREAKIARLNGELQARYEELAAMQRLVMQSTVKGRIKRLVGRMRRSGHKPAV